MPKALMNGCEFAHAAPFAKPFPLEADIPAGADPDFFSFSFLEPSRPPVEPVAAGWIFAFSPRAVIKKTPVRPTQPLIEKTIAFLRRIGFPRQRIAQTKHSLKLFLVSPWRFWYGTPCPNEAVTPI
jgi:hypothetical protein